MNFVCDKLRGTERTVSNSLEAIEDDPNEATRELEEIARALNVQMSELYTLFNENRDMLNGICSKLEGVLLEMGQLNIQLNNWIYFRLI